MRARRLAPSSAVLGALALVVSGCAADRDESTADPTANPTSSTAGARSFDVEEVDEFDDPWAMAFLPGGDLLVTERGGTLNLRDADSGDSVEVSGVPEVQVAGQGGLGDVVVSPDFEDDRTVYLSWAEAGAGGSGAAVGRAQLSDGERPALQDLEVIWRQNPKVNGSGHFGHRIAFDPDGEHLFVTSGERQQKTPAQDPDSDLGKIIRMELDGSSAEHWTMGHRNPLGIDFAPDGTLWSSEMGPEGGDELNVIEQDANYGWPEVSNGSDYGGGEIPDHAQGDGFVAPKAFWTPSISPSSLLIYDGDLFDWKGDALIGALSGEALVRVPIDGQDAGKPEVFDMDERIRAVEQGPDGAVWLLQDGSGGKLLKLTPEAA